jgi:predicted dehydrogenase
MRCAVIGLGWAADSFHLPALRGTPGVEVVGGCDTDAERRDRFVAKTGAPAFDTTAELFERARPDAVVVATPPDSHRALCLEALAAGANVICEKPFVETVEDADAVLAAAAAAGRQVAINHQYREKPIFRAVRDRIGTKDVGRLVFIQFTQLMDLAPWEEPVAWRRAMPNRTLFEGGVHLVDLMLTMTGEPPVAVYARSSSGLDGTRAADAIHLVLLEFPGGRLGQITIDRLCKAGTRYVELRADCEHASLRASYGGRALFQAGLKRAERPAIRLVYGLGGVAWIERGTSRKTIGRNPRHPEIVATRTLFGKILEAFAEGREPPSSAREARSVLEVIAAAYRSAETGERVALSGAETGSASATRV